MELYSVFLIKSSNKNDSTQFKPFFITLGLLPVFLIQTYGDYIIQICDFQHFSLTGRNFL